MQLLPSLQIFKTAALKNDKVPERNHIEEGEEKGLYFNSGVGESGSQKYSNNYNNSENRKASVALLGWCKSFKLVRG